MPDEVFDQWLAETIAERGWPFLAGTEATVGTSWSAFFIQQPLSFWASLAWHRETVPYEDVVFAGNELAKANAIATNVLAGVATFATPIEDSHARFHACADFILQHRRLPLPVVCVASLDASWQLVDGHHRLAALISTIPPDQLDDFPFETWLGQSVSASLQHAP